MHQQAIDWAPGQHQSNTSKQITFTRAGDLYEIAWLDKQIHKPVVEPHTHTHPQKTEAKNKNTNFQMCHVTSEYCRTGRRKEGNVLFNNALNTFYLRLYGVRHMIKDHSDSERGNLLPPHGLLFPISSKGSFICIIPQTGTHTMAFVTPVVEHWLEMRNSSMGPA